MIHNKFLDALGARSSFPVLFDVYHLSYGIENAVEVCDSDIPHN